MTLQTLSEYEIISTFIALASLLAGAYIFGNIFEKIKAPRVVGEIVGGMIWGASCLYLFVHDFSIVRFLVFFVIAFGLEAAGTLIMLQLTDLNGVTKINNAFFYDSWILVAYTTEKRSEYIYEFNKIKLKK